MPATPETCSHFALPGGKVTTDMRPSCRRLIEIHGEMSQCPVCALNGGLPHVQRLRARFSNSTFDRLTVIIILREPLSFLLSQARWAVTNTQNAAKGSAFGCLFREIQVLEAAGKSSPTAEAVAIGSERGVVRQDLQLSEMNGLHACQCICTGRTKIVGADGGCLSPLARPWNVVEALGALNFMDFVGTLEHLGVTFTWLNKRFEERSPDFPFTPLALPPQHIGAKSVVLVPLHSNFTSCKAALATQVGDVLLYQAALLRQGILCSGSTSRGCEPQHPTHPECSQMDLPWNVGSEY